MKKILLPTDSSNKSNEVIDFALEVFKNEPCVFYFLYIYSYEIHGLDSIKLLQGGIEHLEEVDSVHLKKVREQVNHFTKIAYSHHQFHLVCKNSDLIDEVQEAVEKFDIDIILIGNDGRDSKTEIYQERNVNKMINAVKTCPVLVVPLNEKVLV